MDQSDTSAPRKKILIVEDEAALISALKLKLELAGYEVAVARTGEEGFTVANTGGFDLIFLDLMLPELDGFSIMARLNEQGVKTPVVILSSLNQQEDIRKAKDLGAKDFFIKSNIQITDVIANLDKYFQ